ncbi:MAG: hypothetical protein ACOCRK_02345 [bacterium]
MFNYVIFWSESDFYKVSISDVIGLENVKVYYSYFDNIKLPLRVIYRIQNSKKLNGIINIPLKHLWNDVYFKNDFQENNDLCFIFTIKYYYLKKCGYFKYLRRRYENCKIIIYFRDTIESYSRTYDYFDMKHIKDTFDLILTYNKLDAEEYDIIYYPYVSSQISIKEDKSISKSDVFFIGAAKDRLEQILNAYEYLTYHGLKCSFYIIGVKETNKKQYRGVVYNKRLPYNTVLKHVNKTKCLLEITQSGAVGFTFRTTEALMYDKILITDTPVIKDTKFYDENFIIQFKDITEIDVKKIKKNMNCVSYNYNGEYSPKKLLVFIENYFK